MAVRLGGTGGGSGGGERSLDREECDETNGNDGATTTMGKLHVIAVPLELADAALLECSDDDDDDDDDAAKEFSHERYLKGLHRRIVHWLYRRELLSVEAASAATAAKSTRRHPTQQQQKNQQQDIYTTTNNTATRHIQSHPSSSSYIGPNLVIIDNLSVFSSLFGDVLTHAFLTNVRAALKRHAERTFSEVSSAVIMDDVGFDNHKQDGMSTATPTNNHTNETITTITTTNLLAVRCTSPDDGGLYHLDYDDDLDIGSERGRGSHAPSVKGERLRSEHARLLRPWWGMGSGFGGGGGGNALIGGFSDGVAGTTSYSSESGTNVPMGGTIASPYSTICHLEERSHHLSLFPSADIGGVCGPFHTPSSSQWHSTSTSTSLLHKIGMYEYSDGIVDVSPLESGYARDILGRISFTSVWGGRGWWGRGDEFGGAGGGGIGLGIGIGGKEKQRQDGSGAVGEAYASICVNYRCEDGGVRVLRLRSR